MYLIITASPNKDGLTAACGKAAYDGISSAGGSAELIDISELKLQPCRICGNGWGKCRNTGMCIIDDSLADIQEKIRDCEGLFLVTPVYFWQPAERMKYFCDRFRRCEAFREGGSWAAGKQVNLVAAAGGTGNGTVTALGELENWCRHVHAIPQERISVTRFNRAAALSLIEDAGARLVRGEFFQAL
ncbi:MAG TPA: flavodoxin family protein [Bacillota bacterium]|nr:flavodoxin family protein [Bacillota bacterium]